MIVDLFAGPGGLDIAAEALGVPSIGVEWEKSTRETRHAAGLRTTEVGDVAKLNPLDPEVRSARVLTGGPPCQTYSVAGNREGHKALDEVTDLAQLVGDSKTVEELEKAWGRWSGEPKNWHGLTSAPGSCSNPFGGSSRRSSSPFPTRWWYWSRSPPSSPFGRSTARSFASSGTTRSATFCTLRNTECHRRVAARC